MTFRPSRRRISASIDAWVVLPDPSTPSRVINSPVDISRQDTSQGVAAETGQIIRQPERGMVQTESPYAGWTRRFPPNLPMDRRSVRFPALLPREPSQYLRRLQRASQKTR